MRSCTTCMLLACLLFFTANGFGQSNNPQNDLANKITDSIIKVISEQNARILRDSVLKSVKDSLFWDNVKKTAQYPLIKNSEWSGVLSVPDIGYTPDPKMKYKLLFNMSLWSKDSISIKNINGGFAEIGRIINLHIGAGIPKENIEIAIVVHGKALSAYLKNEAYQKKFKTSNPNLDIIKQFTALNAQLLACGQSEVFQHLSKEDLLPEVKTAYSAQIVLSSFQLKGYVLYNIQEDR
jgi:intracellular sulfur oxidation DsrE/DsrF family protein